MKKTYLILTFLSLFTLVHISYGQVGPYFGGPTCATAVPIEAGDGYISNDTPEDDWYYFIAPCDGELEVTNCTYGDNKQQVIYSGSCGSLVTEKIAPGIDCSTDDVDGGHFMSAGDTAYIQIDDTWDEEDIVFDVVFENPECPMPTAESCFVISPEEIALAWFGWGDETDYMVIYGVSGFDPTVEGDSILTVGATSLTITELEEFTCYDFYFLSVCGMDEFSCLGEPLTCCTPEACGGPTSVEPTSITSESFSLEWYGYFEEVEFFEVEWGLEGFEPGTGTSMECYVGETCDFTGLESYECYDVYARSSCGGGVYSAWGGPFTICTLIDSADLDIEGTVYFDSNENGVQDEGEPGINLVSVQSDPEGLLSFTGADGGYITSTLYVEDGVYEIYPELEYWGITSDSLVYTIIADDTYEARDSLDFGLYPDTSIYELNTEIIGGLPRCNDTINYWIQFENTGTTIASGLVHLELDDSLYYVSADILPDSVVDQHVYWSYEDLFFFENQMITVQVGTPDGEADTVSSILTVTVDSLGIEVFSVTESLAQIVLCAFDPNDKTPTPLGEGEFGNISSDTESIEYLIRFQNTGTDTAFNVVIRDQLDPNINWYSLTPLGYSHDMVIEMDAGGQVSFIFNDILLPDSNVNEAASHGFVKYRVALKNDLPVGTSIYNTAKIYFDYNPAIVTNTTVNTLYLDDASIAVLTEKQQILVYPNPFSESTTVYFGDGLSENSSLQIVDLLGNQVYYSDKITGNSVEIQASQFNSGVYILVLRDILTGAVYTKRIVAN